MSNEAKYFEVLSGAVAQVEEDSFEARGVIYDRLWNIVVQKLRDEGQDSTNNLDKERAAFLSAVRRIEFGERPAATPVAEAPPREKARFREEKAAREGKSAPGRPMWGRIAVRLASACVLLAAIGFAYLVIVGRLDASGGGASKSWYSQLMAAALSVGNLFERRAAMPAGPAQRAVLYEESSGTATGHTFSGRAVWRDQVAAASASTSESELAIDAEIPEKKLLMRMSIRRAPDGGAISHFIEFRFLNSDGAASEIVEDVRGLLMKNDELSPGLELVGKVARVSRGAFLMGLSGAAADLGRNLKLLKERPWMDVPLVMKGRTRGILAIEKGTTGQASVDRILTSWGQT